MAKLDKKRTDKKSVSTHAVDPVIAVNNSLIINFKSLTDFPQYEGLFTGKTYFKNSDGEKMHIKWSKIMQLRFLSTEPSKMFFKNNYSDIAYSELKFVHNKERRSQRKISFLPIESLPKLYQKKVGVNATKKKDLMKLCEKLSIPTQYRDFFGSLVVTDDDVVE